MFKEKTYENILVEMLNMAPNDIDTRQGSIFYDAVAPAAFKLAQFYADLQMTFELVFIDSSSGEYLDKNANENGLSRLPAQPCVRNVVFVGTVPNVGERFFAEDQYFFTIKDENGRVFLKAEELGEKANFINSGVALIPVNNIQELTSATLGDIESYGSFEEDDQSLQRRLREKISGPAENGNRQHYKTLCESVAGVGRARIASLWNGANTVKGILINSSGLPAEKSLVDEVQNYIDPNSEGLGEGAANIGAHFTAVSANTITIDVDFKVVLSQAALLDDVKLEAITGITNHLKSLALDTQEGLNMTVRLSALGNIIYDLEGVMDYSNLTINSDSANISIPNDSCAVLGVVTVEQL